MTGTGYVDIAPTADLNLTDGMTLALWVNPQRVGSARLIDKGPAGGSDAYLLDTHPANNLRVITNLGGISAQEELPVGQWSHVALTYDGQALRLYLNGKLVQETKAAGKLGGDGAAAATGRGQHRLEPVCGADGGRTGVPEGAERGRNWRG